MTHHTATAMCTFLALLGVLALTACNGDPSSVGVEPQTLEEAEDGDQGQGGCPCRGGAGFVDEDGDGVCDHMQNGGCPHRGRGFVDEDGDGLCDHMQNGGCPHRGRGFVDEDGDGLCDHMQNGGCPRRGRGFVDEDGDGACDHMRNGGCPRRHGQHRGCPHGG